MSTRNSATYIICTHKNGSKKTDEDNRASLQRMKSTQFGSTGQFRIKFEQRQEAGDAVETPPGDVRAGRWWWRLELMEAFCPGHGSCTPAFSEISGQHDQQSTCSICDHIKNPPSDSPVHNHIKLQLPKTCQVAAIGMANASAETKFTSLTIWIRQKFHFFPVTYLSDDLWKS